MKHLAVCRQAGIDIRRVRQLPFPGQVLVEEGQPVHPEDLVAAAELPGEVFHLDIARGLGIEPSEVLPCLVRDLGEVLEKNDVIAEHDGALPRLVRVPRSGVLLSCRDGVAVIAGGKKTVAVRAGMIGTVAETLPELGAAITAHGGLIQGVWGNGQVGAGILRVQASRLDQAITVEELDSFGEGQVIAAGFCSEKDQLRRILACKPTGLILGVMDARLIERVMALPIPVILLAGFGGQAPDVYTFEMLRARGGDVACANACQPNPETGEWPEVIIPGGDGETSALMPYRTELKTGQRVMALSGDALGKVFTVAELPDAESILESGLSCKTAVLSFDGGEPIAIPRNNLIILN